MSADAGDPETGPGVPGLIGIYLRGVAMGVADAVPGVSGGTIALISGIYERLVDAIAALSEYGPGRLAELVDGGRPTRRATFVRSLREMDVPFLVVLGLGVLTGVVTLANVVDYTLEAYRAVTFAFFFGVILASPVVLRDEVVVTEPRPLVAGVAGAVLSFVVGGLPRGQAEYALPAMFLIGAVAICAMVLPGISGSLVLLVIGAYDTMTGAVSDVTRGVAGAASGGTLESAVEPLTVLLVFAAGALVGLLTFARVVSWAIDAYRVTTMTFLVGVMLGALRTPYLEIAWSVETFTPAVALSLLVAGTFGVVVVLGLDYVTGGLE